MVTGIISFPSGTALRSCGASALFLRNMQLSNKTSNNWLNGIAFYYSHHSPTFHYLPLNYSLHLQQISHKLFLKTHILYISPHKKRTTGIFIIKCLITQNAPNRSNTKFPTTIKTGLEHPNNCTRTILETPRK